MKVTFLGVGSAFSRKNGNSNVLVESGNIKLLIDCSRYCPLSLEEYGLSLKDITHIFVTHLHADHISGLEEMAIMTKFVYKQKLTILSTDSLLNLLWEKSMCGGLEYIEQTPGDLTPRTLSDFFILEPVEAQKWNTIGQDSELCIYLHPTNHVKGLESYGLEVVEEYAGGREKRFFFSGDTKFDKDLITHGIQLNSHVFHDCQLFDTGKDNSLAVHASYPQLIRRLPVEMRKHLWLYHYGDTTLPDAESDGFAGFVKKLQSFTF
jgi:ribonuclease BN (tRNA processing enzyme)